MTGILVRLGCLSLVLTCLGSQVHAQATLIDFTSIPGSFTVDSFSNHYPEFSLASADQWQGDSVYSPYFENIDDRSLGTTGSSPLTIAFSSLVRDVAMDFGSGMLNRSVTVNVAGYLAGQSVYSNTFVTQPVAGGGDEIHAFNLGLVDSIVVSRNGGDLQPAITMDNLSFVVVPEPSAITLAAVAALATFRRRK